MKRINDLDSKDIDYLIDQIPFKALKGWYQHHPNEFAKLIKGFRPDSVSEEIAYSTAKKNKSRDFIAKFVDECTKKWLEEIKEYRDELEKKGYSPASALFDALPKSRFCDNIALYFLLSDDELSENEISELTSAINKYAVKSAVDEDNDNLLSYKEKINELAEENKKLNLKVDSCEKEINQYKSEIEDIQILYKAEQQKNSELSVELDKIENLSMYADSEESTGEEFQEEYPFMSVCKVYTDPYTEKKWLSRLADIEDGTVTRFIKDENKAPNFENRDKLYLQDYSLEDGMIGVWKWNAIPNMNNPESDYVTTKFCSNIHVIEVIEDDIARDSDELIKRLLEGVNSNLRCEKRLFAYKGQDDEYIGVLCRDKDIEYSNGQIKLKKDAIIVPKYVFSAESIINCGGCSFFRRTSMGTPQDICRTKNPVEFAREMLLQRLSIANLKDKGLSRKEAQTFQQIIKDVNNTSFYADFAKGYACTQADAEKYVSELIDSVDKYMEGQDLDTEIISRVLENSETFARKAEFLIKEDWERANQSLIKEGTEKLENLKMQIKEKNDALSKIEDRCANFQKELDEREQIVKKAEEGLKRRTESLQETLGDYISSSTFLSALQFGNNKVSALSSGDEIIISENKSDTTVDGENIVDTEIFVEELAQNLINIGYSVDGAIGMARIIAFCIANRMPIICKYNGEKIACCIEAMFGESNVKICNVPIGCSNIKSISDLMQANDDTHVVYVTGMFDGYSSNLFFSGVTTNSKWRKNALLLISLEGVDINALSPDVFTRAMYIDGSIFLEDINKSELTSFGAEPKFEDLIDVDNIDMKAVGELRGIVTNQSIINYAKYMSAYHIEFSEAAEILLQLLVVAQLNNSNEKLEKLIGNYEFNDACKEIINNYIEE